MLTTYRILTSLRVAVVRVNPEARTVLVSLVTALGNGISTTGTAATALVDPIVYCTPIGRRESLTTDSAACTYVGSIITVTRHCDSITTVTVIPYTTSAIADSAICGYETCATTRRSPVTTACTGDNVTVMVVALVAIVIVVILLVRKKKKEEA